MILETIRKYGFRAKTSFCQRYYGRKYRKEMRRDREKIVEDIAEYTRLSPNHAMSKIKMGPERFRAEWKEVNPKTPADVLEFYETSEWLIYELACFNYFGSPYAYIGRRKISEQAKGRVLDYGGGIGTISVMLSERGLRDITHYELPGKTMEFVKWRFNKRCPKVAIIEGSETEDRLNGQYDTIICFEVIEHLKNPTLHLKRFADHLDENGKLYATATFGNGVTATYHFKSKKTLPELFRDVGLSSKYPILGMWAVATK